MATSDDDICRILSQQHRDSDLAFQLQLQEAIDASLAALPSSSSPPPPVPSPAVASIPDDHLTVPSDVLESDRRQSELKMRRIEENRDRGSVFRLYFKGLVSKETVEGRKAILAGIGVAICDPEDNLVFEVSKALTGNELSRRFAEATALIEGLNAALALELNRITIFCDYQPLYQYITGRWPTTPRKVVMLVNQVSVLQRKFTYCNPTLVVSNDIKFASKFARDAIVSQITKPAESNSREAVKETCVICLEDTNFERIYSVDECKHRYCFLCMKQHVEAKLLHGIVPKCPHEGCKSELDVESSEKFLTPKLVDTMRQRIKEASIPATEKVYCPYPKCSALMSKRDVLKYSKKQITGSKRRGSRVCMECRGRFCIRCKVPWHKGMTCNGYKRRNPNPPAEDVKLKSLANRNLWRQCVKCCHMIELSEGCYHITCRCGFEFCYNCGAEWKDKKATCACPLWDEHNIWDDPDEVEDMNEDEDFSDGDEYEADPEDFY